MKFDLTKFKHAVAATEDWLSREYARIRTGVATPAVLDSVSVESYGNPMKIKDVASITVEEARSLRVTPWDASLVKPLEKALLASNLGLSVRTDETGVRVLFPQLTTERRAEYAKLAGQKLEEARISLRKEREKALKEIDRMMHDGDVNEDGQVKAKAEVQKLVDSASGRLSALRERKANEIER